MYSTLIMLATCRVRACSDPRDGIFAISDIAAEALGTFKADHSVYATGVYKSFTLDIIGTAVSFDMWSITHPCSWSSRAALEGLPSWVINWTNRSFLSASLS